MDELRAAVPAPCLERSAGRVLLSILVSCALLACAEAGLALSPIWLWPPLWLAAGLGAFGLQIIAHDCGHGSLLRSRRANHRLGHLLSLALLFPFHSWRHLHGHHHAHANLLGEDLDWHPLRDADWAGLPRRVRWPYRLMRTVLFPLATLRFWLGAAWRPSLYPGGGRRAAIRRSVLWTAGAGGLLLGLLLWSSGPSGLLRFWLGPWLCGYAWFSLITLVQHTHPEVPFLERKAWTPQASALLLTVNCRFPRWLEFLLHDLNLHVPHHVATAVPHYRLRLANAALQGAFPGLVREFPFRWRHLGTLLRSCHLQDSSGRAFYRSFREPLAAD